MDATAAIALGNVARPAQSRGGRLVLCGVRPGMLGTLERSRVIDTIGRDAIFPHEHEMLASTRRATEFANTLAARPSPSADGSP